MSEERAGDLLDALEAGLYLIAQATRDWVVRDVVCGPPGAILVKLGAEDVWAVRVEPWTPLPASRDLLRRGAR